MFGCVGSKANGGIIVVGKWQCTQFGTVSDER
jgi:hypothetical protein